MNLVLDLDETLIYGDKNLASWLRPYAHEFLDFCFANFETVGIWTAASFPWWEINKNQHFSKYNFAFVLTEDSCVYEWDYNSNIEVKRIRFKPLSKLWKQKSNNLNKDNTIIIDDDCTNSIKNYGNAILIKPFFGEKNDQELKLMVSKLSKVLELYSQLGSVRSIDLKKFSCS